MIRICENCITDFEPDEAGQVVCPACLMQQVNIYSPKTKNMIEGCHDKVDGYRPPAYMRDGRYIDTDFRKESGFTRDRLTNRIILNRYKAPQNFGFRFCKICNSKFYPTGAVDYRCPDCKPTKREKKNMDNERRIMRKEYDDYSLRLSMETCIKLKETSKRYRMSPEKLVNYALEELEKRYLVAPIQSSPV